MERKLFLLVGSKIKAFSPRAKTSLQASKDLERELEWVRMAPKGRQTKQKARLSNYDKLMSQDQAKYKKN